MRRILLLPPSGHATSLALALSVGELVILSEQLLLLLRSSSVSTPDPLQVAPPVNRILILVHLIGGRSM